MSNINIIKWLFIVPLITVSLEIAGQDIVTESKVEDTTKESSFKSEISGNFRGDYRYYPDEALYQGQHEQYFSALFQPEIYLEWNKGKQLLQFTGFARLDQYDTKRSHFDFRELYWQTISKKWELSLGLKKVFWGVAESNHIVDVINQTDVLEGFGLENKLGQPMVHFSWSPKKIGTFDLYAMTYFREMQFPGSEGRLRPPFDLDAVNVLYESKAENYNLDMAVRWSKSYNNFDIGISHFYGTSRQPYFESPDPSAFNITYELIHQTGLDLQVFTGNITWKAEMMHRESKRKTITAFIVGGEYQFSNIFKSGIDLGIIAEYNYDDRGVELISALDDDYFFAMRVGFNDTQSTDFLAGVTVDRGNQTVRYFVEANRRLGDSWKISLEAAGFNNIDSSEFLYLIRNDSYGQVSLAKYF